MKRSLQGFTLLELLAVVTIIGILATLAAIGLANANKRARDARRESDMRNIKTSLELYQQDNGGYPDTEGNLVADLVTNGKYMSVFPSDPLEKQTNYTLDTAKVGGLTRFSYLGDSSTLSNGNVSNYKMYVMLDNTSAKTTFPGQPTDCSLGGASDFTSFKGNGVVVNTNKTACFAVTNE